MPIRFLSKIEQWKDFSNLAPYPIELKGRVWQSSEHYYQYKKFEKADPDYAQKILEAETPKEVKKLSMQNDKRSPEWDNEKVAILKTAVIKKFTSYSNLRDLLLSTGDEELIEANPDDYFWGEGADGTGKNMMGKMLMEIRALLKK
jgi:ribA/ribD-fused uncharacterized protein